MNHRNNGRSGEGPLLLFTGDSITDADHLWEPGPDGLGNGYVHLIGESFRQDNQPVRIVNSGFNGYRAEDLLRRWYRICLEKQPDLVTLLVGVNEVGASMEGMVTEPEVFARTYERLITEVQTHTGADMILMEPFLFRKPAFLIPWRLYLDPLLEVIEGIAKKHSLPLIRLDQPLNELASQLGVDAVTRDGIHLTETGNLFLARQWRRLYDTLYGGERLED